MNPNETLAILRNLMRNRKTLGTHTLEEWAESVAIHFEGLDKDATEEGLLPTDWRRTF